VPCASCHPGRAGSDHRRTGEVRKGVTLDWTVRESARAKIRVMVRRILNKHGYPPDLREEATKLVLEQAQLLCVDWATGLPEEPIPDSL